MRRAIVAVVILALSAAQADAGCILFLCFGGHHRHHYSRSTLYDPAFCAEVQKAFAEKNTLDLARYVDSVPKGKLAQAARCLNY